MNLYCTDPPRKSCTPTGRSSASSSNNTFEPYLLSHLHAVAQRFFSLLFFFCYSDAFLIQSSPVQLANARAPNTISPSDSAASRNLQVQATPTNSP